MRDSTPSWVRNQHLLTCLQPEVHAINDYSSIQSPQKVLWSIQLIPSRAYLPLMLKRLHASSN